MGPTIQVFSSIIHLILNFSDFVYFNWQTWRLDDNGGPVAEKKFEGQIWALFRFVSKLIFSTATSQNFFILLILIDSSRFRYNQESKKYLGLIRPKFGPEFGFRHIAKHRLIQFVICHTF